MLNRHFVKRSFATALLAASAACSSVPPSPHNLLDEHTGVTVSVVGAPTLFARSRNDAAAPVHDYLTLVALRNDNAGKYTELLLLYRWSAFYQEASAATEQNAGRLLIEVDGRTIELHALDRVPTDIPRPKELFVPDTSNSAMSAYVTDFETLKQIATSHQLLIRLPQDPLDTPFSLWHDGRPALGQFVKELSGS
jgi:hypothetical protein